MRLAVELEDLAEAQPGRLLDALVELDEAGAEAGGEQRADGRLAGAADAEQRDRIRCAAGRGGAVEELGGRGAQRGGDVGEARQRDVAGAGLELGEEALGDAGLLRQLAPGHAAALAQRADAGTDGGEQRFPAHGCCNIVQR